MDKRFAYLLFIDTVSLLLVEQTVYSLLIKPDVNKQKCVNQRIPQSHRVSVVLWVSVLA